MQTKMKTRRRLSLTLLLALLLAILLVLLVALVVAFQQRGPLVQLAPIAPLPPRGSHGQIAVVSERGTLTLYDGDGGHPWVLGPGSSPAWSPDGSQLAYDTDCGKLRCLRVVTAAGAVSQFANAGGLNDQRPAWSPDGRRLAFESWKQPFCIVECIPPTDIYIMNVDGTQRTHVSPGSSPAWSPDGRHIAFVRRDGDFDRLYLANADGSGLTLLPGAAAYFDERPAWSPDGRQIAFTGIADGGGSGGIFVIDADGSHLRQLTALREYAPAWSPDGKRLAFDGLYIMPADGGRAQSLAQTSTGSTNPQWSPDGTRLAYTSASSSSESKLFYDTVHVCVISADGGAPTCFAPDSPNGLTVTLDIAWRP